MIAHAPIYAIGAHEQIAKAIDQWIEDCQLHGGIIADRNCVDGHIVADWGVRVIQGMARIGLDGYGVREGNGGGGRRGDNYPTPADKIRRAILFPESDSSPEREAGDINNLKNQIANHDDDDDPGDDIGSNGPGPRIPSGRRARDGSNDDKAT